MNLGFDGQYEGFMAIVVITLFFLIIALILSAPVYISTIIGSFLAKKKYRNKRLAVSTVITEFEPPIGISPAELGYLYDSRLKLAEIVATILDLKQKGYIEFDGSGKLTRMNTSEASQRVLKPHEVVVMNTLNSKMKINKLAKSSFKKFTPALKNSLVSTGLIEAQKATINYKARRTIIVYLALSALIYLRLLSGNGDFFSATIVYVFISIFMFPATIGIAIVIGRTYDNIVGQPSIWTDELKKIWPKVEGFKNYVETVELDRIKFETKSSKDLTTNKTMPYAVALGMSTGWEKQLKKVD